MEVLGKVRSSQSWVVWGYGYSCYSGIYIEACSFYPAWALGRVRWDSLYRSPREVLSYPSVSPTESEIPKSRRRNSSRALKCPESALWRMA